MKQDKVIYIEGQKFVAERLAPNFRGEYDQICEECAFGTHCYPDDPFGYYKYCNLVKCIDHDKAEGNTNVWVKEQN